MIRRFNGKWVSILARAHKPRNLFLVLNQKNWLWISRIIMSLKLTKTILPFSRRPEKMVFPRKLHWIMIFLVLLGKMIFLFSKNMILFLRQIMKDDLSSNTWKYNIFFKSFKKRVFSKKLHWNMIFLVLSDDKRWYFFPQNMTFFLWTENERWSFSKYTWKYDIFCIYVHVL